ncbi:MAG TPA: CDP-6-deoxy-delta-3,4-glucoseen reductase [Methylophilus sp.]
MNRVLIENSGHTFEVRPSQTVLEAAIEAGINLPYGCRNGACGACKGKVLTGKVMHDDYQGNALTDAELAAGMALFCCARPLEDLVIECRQIDMIQGIKPRILPVRVQHKEQLGAEVMVLHLQLPATEQLTFMAGQYVEFLLKDGRRRAFSIANAPHETGFIELHVRRIAGGHFTEQVFNEMPVKTILRIEAPLGSFFLRDQNEKPIIMVAGGTGFAPVKGMIEHMIFNQIQRTVYLYRGARQADDLYMDALCQRWTQFMPNIEYIPVISDGHDADGWDGRRGLVHEAVLEDHADLSGFEVYVCGAPGMVDIAKQTFVARGLPEEEFYSDAFTFAPQ